MKECPLCSTRGRSRLERHLDDIALLQCDSCGFVYADLPDELILQVNSEYDDAAADTYHDCQTFLDNMWFSRIATRFTKKLGPGRVLDVGCGNGRLLYHFGRLGWNCCGVDTSPWGAKSASLYRFELFQGTIENVASQIGEFDLVVSCSTLEHIARPVPHIEAIAQVLKSGGHGYFCGMPNYGSLSVRLGFSAFHNNRPPGHVNYFTAPSLRKLFQFAHVSFRSVAVRTYGIPEMHRAYNAITEFIRKHDVPSAAQGSRPPPSSTASSGRQPSGMKKVFSRFVLGTYYHSGRVASAGDGLEATILK